MDKVVIGNIFAIFAEDNPNPKTELEYVNEYTLLIAIVMSAQSTDVGVNKATKELFKKVDNPKNMLILGEEGLKNHIKTIGLFNSKAKHVIALSEMLIKEYDNVIPDDLSELQKLPGVGRKTANVFLNCARGHETMGVDTHVQRVSNRIGIVKTTDVVKTELGLLKKIPKKYKKDAHHWLILHGRYVCKARKPECGICKIEQYCKKRI